MSTRRLNAPIYIAQVQLTTKAGERLADVGDTCEQVPASSLPWLIAQGLIVEHVERVGPDRLLRLGTAQQREAWAGGREQEHD